MPDRLRAAFSPTLLGGYLSILNLIQIFIDIYFQFTDQILRSASRRAKVRTDARRRSSVLEFLVIFVQAKRT
jgi:hypothetical protein